MARVVTKIGDVFSVKIDDDVKKYFQLVAFDLAQLNSDVIRAFKTSFPLDACPDLAEVVSDEVDFHVHCVTSLGVKMGLWEKLGKAEVGDTSSILFKDTLDYGYKVGEERVRVSSNWRVWHINDECFTEVGRLEGENRRAEMGLVINPNGIVEMLRGNKVPLNYPGFE
jgi:hypothetical protein